MRYVKNEILCGIRIVAMMTMMLVGTAAVACADGPELNTFSPGTTIKSSEVNQNFSALSNALPGLKWVGGAPPNGFSFTTDWQTVTQMTLTAPSDGTFLIFANTQVAFNLQQNGGNMVNFCVSTSPSSNDGRGIFGVSFVAPCSSCSSSLSVPVNSIATVSASKGAPATFYLLAQKAQNTTDTISLASASMFAVFLPKQWSEIPNEAC